MNGALVTATVAPLLAAPSVRSEQVSQLVLGEGGRGERTERGENEQNAAEHVRRTLGEAYRAVSRGAGGRPP